MTAIVAAVKRDPARRLIQNLLSEFNHRSLPFEVSGSPVFNFKVGCEIRPVLRPDPGNNQYSIDITGSDITAFFLAEVYASFIEFSFSVNSVFPPGPLGIICAKKKLGICVLWLPLFMPRLPTLTFRIQSFRPLPIMALDTWFSVKGLESGDLIDADHRELKAQLSLARPPGIFHNGTDFAGMIIDFVHAAIDDRLKHLGFLGLILQHVVDFVGKIVDKILGPLKFAENWLHFVESRVLGEVTSRIARVFGEEPGVKIKVGRVPARKAIAPEFVAPSGQHQAPVYVNFDRMVMDVNADCPAGPEFRFQVNVS